MYQDIIASFSIPVLSDRFDMLRQLGNIFIVQPTILRTYMNESHLARIDKPLLRPYLTQRADWGDYSRKFWDTEVLGMDNTDTQADGPTSKLFAGLMKEFDNFSLGDMTSTFANPSRRDSHHYQ